MERVANAFVYVVTQCSTGMHYVGKTNDPVERWGHHRRTATKGPGAAGFSRLHAAIRKHGADGFRFSVIGAFETEEQAYAAESDFIGALGSNLRERGFNLDSGGIGGKKRSEETIVKLRAATLANPRRYWLGRRITNEMRAAISRAFRGRPWSDRRRAAGQASLRGRTRPPEVVARIAEANRGKIRGPMSSEWREKISAAHLNNPLPTEDVRDRAHRGWVTRRAREAAKSAPNAD